ncbi:TPA: head decoration protein [Escherichia coli]|nr:head decoration protein [Escherichia coli]HBC1012505.1 head decoration protein [Escherichia coli]
MTQVFGNNPFSPGCWSVEYSPDQLIAGPLQLITKTVTLTGGEILKRGTVLGRITSGGIYTICKRGSDVTDGSDVPVAVLMDDVDTSGGDAQGGVYLMGEFNAGRVIFDESWTVEELTTELEKEKIFLRLPVSAR